MRDPARIPQILAVIEEAWSRQPDLRLGQLLMSVVRPENPCPELFGIEDEVLARRIEKATRPGT